MATNYLGPLIGLIWDTLLPGVIPVISFVAVQDRVTEDTIHGLFSLCWFPTKHSDQLQLSQPQFSLRDTIFLLQCSVILVHLLSQNQLCTIVQWKGELHEVLA